MLYQDPKFALFMWNVIKSDLRHDSYKECCKHAAEMGVHLYGSLPAQLLNVVRPREDPETKQYRLAAYQATTKSTSEKALSILAKIFNPSIFSIKWKDQSPSAKQLEVYTLEEYPEFNSIINFLSESVLKKMLADPNGVIAARPKELLIPQTERAEAICKVFGSPNIWFWDEEMYLIWVKTVIFPHPRNEVYYFEYYDDVNIIEFTAEFQDPQVATITELAVYPHGCDEKPIWQLKGTPELQDNGSIVHKSFFDGALPFWNLAVTHESDLFGAYINHLHPLRAELAEECDYRQDGQRCKGGMLTMPTGDSHTCPSCNGTGYRSVKSPYGVYQYDKDKLEEGTKSFTPVQYITIPTDATKMLEERVDKMHEKGLNAINMDIVNKVGANQSGVAKVIDRQELYDFMLKISGIIFDVHLNNIYYYFNILMFKVSQSAKPSDPMNPTLDANLPEINKPINFDIADANELLNQMDATKKAGMNPEFLRQAQKEIMAKKFATSSDIKMLMDLVIDLDPLPDLMVTDIIALQSGMQKMWILEDQIIHFNIGTFVTRALEEDEAGFLTLDEDQQLEQLRGYAKEIIDATKVTLNPQGLIMTDPNNLNLPDFNSQQTVNKITKPVEE